MNQPELFSRFVEPLAPAVAKPATSLGEVLKQEGQSRAASAKSAELAHARVLARCIAENGDGTCHADLVAEALAKGGRAQLGNAAGVFFQTDEWEFTGERVKSKRAQAHTNELKVWRLKDA